MAWQHSTIDLPFAQSNLQFLMSQGALGSMSRYSHLSIVHWCDQASQQPRPVPAWVELADDVVVQWELYLASKYTLTQMSQFSLSDVVLPKYYFHNWLESIE